MKQKPINWKLYVLAGYLLAQLTPQVRTLKTFWEPMPPRTWKKSFKKEK